MTMTLAELQAEVADADPAELELMRDGELLELLRDGGALRRRVDTLLARVAAEIARRSSRESGYAGLAQRSGARTPELLVQRELGTSLRHARDLVEVGRQSGDADAPVGTLLRSALATGALSVEAGAAITNGLGRQTDRVDAATLARAAGRLVAEASGTSVEQLHTRAREVRDELDAAGVVDRERELRRRRSLRLVPQDDGMTRMVGLLDPKSAALVTSVVDAATSPRRGGPRFVDPGARARADAIAQDERTTEQLALDAVVGLIEAGAAAAPERLPLRRGAAVQVVVAERDLRWLETSVHESSSERRATGGPARVEGQRTRISTRSALRRVCADGALPIVVDGRGEVVDVGRTQRLFTARQRAALAARDGGCRFPGCDRPPSWCEAHHIVPWAHGGLTAVRDGVLVCRHHHLLLHDNGWRFARGSADALVLIPPRERDPLQRAIPAPPKTSIPRRAAS